MIMMTRAILLPPPPSLSSRNPGLGPGSGFHMDQRSGSGRRRSAWVKCHHQAGSGLSAVGDDGRRGKEGRDARNRGRGRCTRGEGR